MKVILANTAGFCMGVRRAMNRVIEATRRHRGPVYTLGPLVHNNQAMKMLRARRVVVAKRPEEVEGGTLFIRAHGVTPAVRQECNRPGVAVHDLTCPHVRRAQKIIERHAAEGLDTIIVGDENHAEVIGLLGHAEGRGYVVGKPEDVARLPHMERVCLVAQTTQSAARFEAVVSAVKERFPETEVFNTICNATDERQDEVRELAARVDAMVVVGGQHSGNTVRLAQVASETGVPTFHIETEQELVADKLEGFETVGVTAGASTPHWVFQAVVEKLESVSRTRSRMGKLGLIPLRLCIYTYLYLGAGSAAMTYAVLDFLRLQSRPGYLALSFMYVVSMHILNRFTDRAAAEINDPLRMGLFARRAPVMMAGSILCAGGALGLAAAFGLLPALLMTGSLAAGIGYNLRVVPAGLARVVGFVKVKDIAGSKDLFTAFAWATVTVLLPCLAEGSLVSLKVLGAFVFVFTLVLARSLLFDLKDLEGDRLVGNETLPLLVGRRATGAVLVGCFVLLAGLIVAGGLTGDEPGRSVALSLPVLFAAMCTLLYFRGAFVSRKIRFELAVDAQFLLIGLTSWLA